MNYFELILVIGFIVSSIYLIWKYPRFSIFVFLTLAVFQHKEMFALVGNKNVLPIRIFMASYAIVESLKLCFYIYQNGLKKVFEYVKSNTFIWLLLAVWFSRIISLVNSQNIVYSISLMAFFSTTVAFGISFYVRYRKDQKFLLSLLNYLINLFFVLSLIGYIQFAVYEYTGFIFGALWNIPGNLSRIGTLFWDVNRFAAVLASLMPILGIQILQSSSKKDFFIKTFKFLSMLGILLLTSSRSAWILAFVSFLVFCGLMLYRYRGFRGLAELGILIVIISSILTTIYMDKDSDFRRVVKDRFHYRIDSFDSHMMLLVGAGQVFTEVPVLGTGYGGFYEYFKEVDIAPDYFSRDPAGLVNRVPAHSIWGEVGAETGVIGLIIFLTYCLYILGVLLFNALKAEKKGTFLINTAMFGSLLGWLCAGVFYSYKIELFYFVFYLYLFLGLNFSKESESETKFYLSIFTNKWVQIASLSVLAFFLIFVSLGKNHFVPWDEAIYAEITKNMVESGDYLTLSWENGDAWFEKPPMIMWLQAFFLNLKSSLNIGFVSNEFFHRLPSAFAGFFSILFTYQLAHRLFKDRLTSFLAGFVLLTSTSYLYYSRLAMFDIVLSFFILAAVLSYVYYSQTEKKYLLVLTAIFAGFAILTKGVIGFLVFPIILFYDLAAKQFKFKNYVIVGLLSLLVSMPWHIYMYMVHGHTFYNVYIEYHVLKRATENIEDKGKPFWHYNIVLRVGMRIWYALGLLAVPFTALRSWFSKNHRFLLFTSSFIFLFFSFPTSKLNWYILPLYPFASIIVADFISRGLGTLSLGNPFKKLFLSYVVIFLGLSYLFVERALVYYPDLTGSQARLLKLKDSLYGTDSKVYADIIEKPLVLYYSDSPYEITDFSILRDKVTKNKVYDKEFIIVSKESRARTLRDKHGIETLEIIEQDGDWILSYIPSQLTLDKRELKIKQAELESLNKELIELKESRLNTQRIELLITEKLEEIDTLLSQINQKE
jgi:4-amino-4-deoxy-L-arabinose transferase-like glycosyltransferase